VVDEWHIIALEGSRGITLEQLKNEIGQQGTTGKVIAHDSFTEAYKLLKKCANFEDRVVAFGSFLVVSQILKINGASKDHG
jgi:dihydrofolate synthase/folylpolyglutamate synthase